MHWLKVLQECGTFSFCPIYGLWVQEPRGFSLEGWHEEELHFSIRKWQE